MRVKAVISYNGTKFNGFQRQKETKNTVSGKIEEVFKKLNIESIPIGSGRTDNGVHATGQVVHFDIPYFWQDRLGILKDTLNKHLFPNIFFKSISTTNSDFHARYCAKKRVYRYIFKQHPTTPFDALYCKYLPDIKPLMLKSALKVFEGKNDFLYFHKKGSNPSSTVRVIYRADIYIHRGYIIAIFEANGFLRSQVRMMIDTAIKVMREELDIELVKEQLNGKKSFNANPASPYALYLSRVLY